MKIEAMFFNLPPYAKVLIKRTTDLLLITTELENLFNKYHWKYKIEHSIIKAYPGSNFFSPFGEEIIIELKEYGIQIVSRSYLPQILDWGNNKRNVEFILNRLKEKGLIN